MPELPQRKSIRLSEYDYSQFGYYFITICAQNREICFENNDVKQIIDHGWQELKNKFSNIDLDEYVVMPNHLHGIIIINDINDIIVGAGLVPARQTGDHKTGDHKGRPYRRKPTLGDIIGAFKSITTNEYINGIKTKNWPEFNQRLWQRNYYEHIIRNDESLNRIRYYIKTNPDNWNIDRNNPKNIKN